MAIMIPSIIEDCEAARKSHEDEIFEALQRIQDNNLYVFHSYTTIDIKDNVLDEHEIDFIIFHKDLGMLFLESKSSNVGDIYFDGEWKYGNNAPMNHNPFMQADRNKWNVFNIAKSNKYKSIHHLIDATKFIHCVCFPTMTSASCDRLQADGSYSRKLLITRDDLESPEKTWNKLKEISSIELKSSKQFRALSESEAKLIVDKFLCPHMNVFPSRSYLNDSQNFSFNRLLKKQSMILDFLELENSVVITGGAGTGKTVVAVEKAKRLASEGENVIFLCFNKELKQRLEIQNKDLKSVKFYTLSGFLLALTGSFNDYNTASNKILEFFSDGEDLKIGNTEYRHIIIDEGQDFGSDDEGVVDSTDKKESFLNELRELILERNGCFYVFYDKQQLIQSKKIPDFIEKCDSRLSLRQNVRNTENIGKAALKTISDSRCFIPNTIVGDVPSFYIASKDDICKNLDGVINNNLDLKDIVIITLGTVENSLIYKSGRCGRDGDNHYYQTGNGNRIKLTTCRKFKGCEADVVILVDVDADSFKKDLNGSDTQENFIYYVGASRAKKKLNVFLSMNENECKEILPKINKRYERKPITNPFAQFVSSLGGFLAH